MSDLNQVTLTGNLCRDSEVSYTSTGTALCKFSIAVNKSYKKDDEWKDEVSFFNVTAWGKLAERSVLSKGQCVLISGELKQDRWNNTEGKSQQSVNITAHTIEKVVREKKTSE